MGHRIFSIFSAKWSIGQIGKVHDWSGEGMRIPGSLIGAAVDGDSVQFPATLTGEWCMGDIV